MRIDDQIRADSFLSEWHILLAIGHANGSLLAMSCRELISNLGYANGAHLDFSKSISLLVGCEDHLVDHAVL